MARFSATMGDGVSTSNSSYNPTIFDQSVDAADVASLLAERIRSIARFRATVVSQAAGRSGTPSFGHRAKRRGERVLGQHPIAGLTNQTGDDASPIGPVGSGNRVGDVGHSSQTKKGRISMRPKRAIGCREA